MPGQGCTELEPEAMLLPHAELPPVVLVHTAPAAAEALQRPDNCADALQFPQACPVAFLQH